MKFLPDAIARKVASQQLLAKQNSPRILFVGGMIGMVGSTVLACRATLKVEEVLDEVEREKETARRVKAAVEAPGYDGNASYTDDEVRRDLTIITIRGAGKIARLYAPSLVLGAVSVAALTKSHMILQDRTIALTAAYTAVEAAYSRYRERVIERYGEDVDRELRYDTEEVDLLDEETGKLHTVTQVIDAPGSIYARWFDQEASRNWSVDPDINLYFLRTVQTSVNDRLRARGHVFLNEVYDELGLTHTQTGSLVGWRWNQGTGDDYIDFGIWDGTQERVKDFFNGREGAILLDFNVDRGTLFDKMDIEDGHE